MCWKINVSTNQFFRYFAIFDSAIIRVLRPAHWRREYTMSILHYITSMAISITILVKWLHSISKKWEFGRCVTGSTKSFKHFLQASICDQQKKFNSNVMVLRNNWAWIPKEGEWKRKNERKNNGRSVRRAFNFFHALLCHKFIGMGNITNLKSPTSIFFNSMQIFGWITLGWSTSVWIRNRV